jgi:hypothetical protein
LDVALTEPVAPATPEIFGHSLVACSTNCGANSIQAGFGAGPMDATRVMS